MDAITLSNNLFYQLPSCPLNSRQLSRLDDVCDSHYLLALPVLRLRHGLVPLVSMLEEQDVIFSSVL